MIKRFNKISLKIGLLFSGLFLILLLLLGYLLYALFSIFFTDYIVQDLVKRGQNHATVLEENYSPTTLMHITLMEEDVFTSVIITDKDQEIVASSGSITEGAKSYLHDYDFIDDHIVTKDWREDDYLVTVSPIDDGEKGYVYMFYPTVILKETLQVFQIFLVIAGIGTVLIGLSLIAYFSKRMTKPLLEMKNATNKLAKGDFHQTLNIQGDDELAQLGQSIQLLGEKLNYYETSRNEFLASVSHELRTPLTYIRGFADVLRKGRIKDEQEIAQYLDIIYEETNRVNLMVNDLFDIAKMQTGKFQLHKEPTEINQLLEGVIQTLRPLAEEKELEISYIKSANIYLNIDPSRMKQVFYNLIENAIKYTDQGKIEVSVKSNKHCCKITFRDTGIGISDEDIVKIWERFYRVDKSRDRESGGTGLGLYVVKQIVELHGGEIHVESREHKGTTFTINFRNDVEL